MTGDAIVQGVLGGGFAGLFAIGTLVCVHELGHWAVARLFGIGTPVFSVGMGPRLFGFHVLDTDFRISALPIGGFVLMEGADMFGEEDAEADVPDERKLFKRPVWQRLAVAFAGPAVNLILPFFLLTAALVWGRPELASQVGDVLPGTPAAVAGFQPGDVITAIDGEPIAWWSQIFDALEARIDADAAITVTVQRAGAAVDVVLPPHAVESLAQGGPNLTTLGALEVTILPVVGAEASASPAGRGGIQLGDTVVSVDGVAVDSWRGLLAALSGPRHDVHVMRFDATTKAFVEHDVVLDRTMGDYASPAALFANPWGLYPGPVSVGTVRQDGAAYAAGVRDGDRVASLDGQPVSTFSRLRDLTRRALQHDGVTARSVSLAVVRDGQLHTFEVTPAVEVVPGETEIRPLLGLQQLAGVFAPVPERVHQYSLAEAATLAPVELWGALGKQLASLRNLFTGYSRVDDTLGGPVAIFGAAAATAQLGAFYYLTMLAMLSLSLGVINLLPVPVLDGGRILFDLAEAVRGRPVSIEFRERAGMVSAVALVLLLVYVTQRDVQRLFAAFFT